ATMELAPERGLPGISWPALSQDAQFAAAKWNETTLKIWDLSTGKERAALAGNFPDRVSYIAFSRDAELVAGAISLLPTRGFVPHVVVVWNVKTGKHTVVREQGPAVSGLEFSEDGKRLAAPSNDAAVRIWDIATGKERFSLKHPSQVQAAVFSPDDRWLASGCGDGNVRLWNAATGQLHNTCRGHDGAVLHVAFNSDGKKLASAGGDGTVRIWDVASGRELLLLRGHTASVRRVAFGPGDR